jgi:hypothetical protein
MKVLKAYRGGLRMSEFRQDSITRYQLIFTLWYPYIQALITSTCTCPSAIIVYAPSSEHIHLSIVQFSQLPQSSVEYYAGLHADMPIASWTLIDKVVAAKQATEDQLARRHGSLES